MRAEAELFVNREISTAREPLQVCSPPAGPSSMSPSRSCTDGSPGREPGYLGGTRRGGFLRGTLKEADWIRPSGRGSATLAGFEQSRKAGQPSPVERGVYILDRFLCNKPSPPPDQVPDLDEATAAEEVQTNREKYAKHTSDPLCAGCHVAIDGIGFTFENYDSMGAWRDTDNGFPVDATGELVDRPGWTPHRCGGIGPYPCGESNAHDCHVTNWTRYAWGVPRTGWTRPIWMP